MARVLVATLADAVAAAAGQKFSVLGGSVDTFHTQSFPVTLMPLALLLALEIEAGTDVKVDGKVSFKHPSGEVFLDVGFQLARSGTHAKPSVVWQGLNLPPLNFTAPEHITIVASVPGSSYEFSLDVAGPTPAIFPTPVGTSTN